MPIRFQLDTASGVPFYRQIHRPGPRRDRDRRAPAGGTAAHGAGAGGRPVGQPQHRRPGLQGAGDPRRARDPAGERDFVRAGGHARRGRAPAAAAPDPRRPARPRGAPRGSPWRRCRRRSSNERATARGRRRERSIHVGANRRRQESRPATRQAAAAAPHPRGRPRRRTDAEATSTRSRRPRRRHLVSPPRRRRGRRPPAAARGHFPPHRAAGTAVGLYLLFAIKIAQPVGEGGGAPLRASSAACAGRACSG